MGTRGEDADGVTGDVKGSAPDSGPELACPSWGHTGQVSGLPDQAEAQSKPSSTRCHPGVYLTSVSLYTGVR